VKENLIKTKSFEFALLIIELYKKLKNNNEFVFANQLLKSGTSIGANVAESEAAQSKADFISKLSIAAKEARETKYWLDLLEQGKVIEISVSLELEKVIEIIKILTSIIKTSSGN
jgi:four helix bundle protein